MHQLPTFDSHLLAWSNRYRDDGLVVIGVHTPEYAFEKIPANVSDGARKLGITYPIAMDNNFSTWTNYRNRYWPARYLIDAHGHVRQITFGKAAMTSPKT
ncbi:cytochrome c biogenesis protein DipZ [Mycolicibacterium aubagnense]